jgi:chemotaxis protein CheD
VINVGVAEWKTASNPDALRTTLGSCVGIILYSSKKKAGGLAHILLGEAPGGKIVKRGKYARPAIESLFSELARKYELSAGDLTARIFGGASMFETINSKFLQSIGVENVNVARETLNELKIPVIAEEVGGTAGRTVTLFLDDGRVLLRSNGKEKFLYKA